MLKKFLLLTLMMIFSLTLYADNQIRIRQK